MCNVRCRWHVREIVALCRGGRDSKTMCRKIIDLPRHGSSIADDMKQIVAEGRGIYALRCPSHRERQFISGTNDMPRSEFPAGDTDDSK